MDLQACLKTSLRNKYQKLKDKPLFPPRLCYLEFKQEEELSKLNQHEFSSVDKSDLHQWVVFPTVPLTHILSSEYKHDSGKKTVLTVGVSGVGKSTAVQSCALKWAQDKDYHHINLLFPLNFWELNLLKNKLSLIELLQTFYPELKRHNTYSLNGNLVWFVLDGLDEYKVPLNFSCPTVIDVSEASTVDILLINLIRGNLLPSCHIWITTRYSAVRKIPDRYLLKETMIQGFSDEQKEQLFRGVILNDGLASKAINHVKISRSLDFLCEIPPLCNIMANVLKNHIKPTDGFKITPLSLTQIYANLVSTSDLGMISKLKKLALHRMTEGNVMYEDDLVERGISVKEASIFCKEWPLVLWQETGLHKTKAFRFGHLSIQEFLAASAKLDEIEGVEISSRSGCCKHLVEQAMLNEEGKSDVFLRFIFGLIKERHLLEPTDELFVYTKKKILEHILSYKAVRLFHCLREFDSQALLEDVRFFMKYGSSPIPEFTSLHWNFMIQRARTFEGVQDHFEMPLSMRCDENLLRYLPAIQKSRKAMLRFSNLTDASCPALAAILGKSESYLRELDLGYNTITDDGVWELTEELKNKNCKLKTLRLQSCGLDPQACKYLVAALTKSPKLKELDLSKNNIGNDGLWHLSCGLRVPECKLETLRLSQCNIEKTGCSHLALSLQDNPSHLKVLDLSINPVGDGGARELFECFDISQLTKLEMYHCSLTGLSCKPIGEALKSETSTLIELNLSNNDLKDEGFIALCMCMYAWCRLEKLNVSRCGITQVSCTYLAKVLCSVSQLYSGLLKRTDWQAVGLTDLDLSMNLLGDAGVKEISAGLKNPYSHLKTLNLSHCGLTDSCCAELASGLGSDESTVTELDLSGNQLRDKGVKKLCIGLNSPDCKLEKLSLRSCDLTSKSIHFLISVHKSKPQSLTELHLMGNKLEDSDIRVLTELTKNTKYSLQIIDVSAD
ncbi:NACHT, LRR and PYD domains-containing protein 12-like [Mugil cephalus]|uniref:NACHT, LRR and PYD domains-containing protein 12-like n=1 Tax=Mugil cephalus TaxID=48193 RepID=UPI001FB65014|nr:NACHT, LRR and PYD domains-containing protein 12-like [Mugil cephalus]